MKKNNRSFDKIIKIVLYTSLLFFTVGLFWILIATEDVIGLILISLGCISGISLCLYKLKNIKDFFLKIDWKTLGTKFYYILIFISIIVIINVIANKRFYRKDFTINKRYTLSDHSLSLFKALEKNQKEIKMIFFRSQIPLTSPVVDLLKEYKARCPIISLETVDPDKDPIKAKQYNVRSIGVPYQNFRLYGTIIILSAGLKESVDVIKVDYKNVGGRYQPSLDIKDNVEKDISSALLRLSKSKKKIYFVSGHGEVDLNNEESTGWFEAKKVIADENYLIDKVYLASLGKVPNDCNVLIIGAPQKNYTDDEYKIINKYLNDGGQLFVMVEPLINMNINKLLTKWGIKTSDKFVIDPASSYWFKPIIPLIKEYNFHKITEKLKYATFFPTLAPIQMNDKKPEGVDIEIIAKTSDNSWIENDTKSKKIKYNKGVDKSGPITAMVAITKKISDKKETRIVIIGDSDFASNNYVKSYGNTDLLLNTLNWLSGKEELIGIRSKPVERREIQLSTVQQKFIFFSCVVILPLLIIIAGVFVWLKRRRK